MKSTDNRYRPPRVQNNIDAWARRAPKKPLPDTDYFPDSHAGKFGKKKSKNRK